MVDYDEFMDKNKLTFYISGMVNRHKNELLDYFDMYKIVENLFENQNEISANKLNRLKKEKAESKHRDIEEDFSGDFDLYGNRLPELFRFSTYITVIAKIEHMLCDHCIALASYIQVEYDGNRLLGFGIPKALSYLKNTIGLKISYAIDNKQMGYILTSLRELRNMIVHRNGIVHFIEPKKEHKKYNQNLEKTEALIKVCQRFADENKEKLHYKMGEQLYIHMEFMEWLFKWLTETFYIKFEESVRDYL